MMKTALVITLSATILLLGGCHNVLMKSPVVAADGLIDPFERVIPERQSCSAPVFVASARTVSGKIQPDQFYTNDRSRAVRIGMATVEVGPGMTWEELTRESRAEKRRRDPEVRMASYVEYGSLWSTAWPPAIRFDRDWVAPAVDREPSEKFVAAIEEMLRKSRRRQISIYVHGFNTRFGDNVMKTAEFWHYMARDDVPICFDWPSRGSVFSYHVDKANADFAVRQFRELLQFLARETSAARINIIAHSAGNPVVVEALRQLSMRYYDLEDTEAQRRTKIGRVVFAAPDMDLDSALSAGIDGVGRITEGFAIYASRDDKALGFSGDIFGDVRVGSSIGKLPEDVRDAAIKGDRPWIDVTNAQRRAPTFLGHSYFHENPWVSSDLMLFLALGATPAERGLNRDTKTGFLVFPDDYEERLPEIVARLRAKYALSPTTADLP
jgi:esterase/lipase superfamily enzyme